jgi:hypothetical protein
MTWQPIETAPKDRRILVFEPGDCDEEGFIDVVHWYMGDTEDYWADWDWKKSCNPTHWQPLPAPPLEKAS